MIGKKVSHYHILEKLGAGGMGVVYKAEDTRLQRTVALKFLPPELTRDPDAKARFIREAQAASALDHPKICTIHDINETNDGRLFIVMACYQGATLKDKLKDIPLIPPSKGDAGGCKSFSVEESIDITTQIAEGLAKAHEKGIVHRDIKPANIFITNDGLVKILDFGLAKLAGQAQLTKDSSTLGTVAYMSPEQLSGKEIDQRTDIWSLGVILYEMLTGQLPFGGEYEQSIIYSILNEEPASPDELRADITSELWEIIQNALKKDPNLRYDSSNDIITDLKKYQKSMISSEVKPPYFTSLFNFIRKPPVIAALIFVVLIAFWVSWFIYRQSKIAWTKEVVIPEINQLIKEAGYVGGLADALELAEEAEKYIPNDPNLTKLLSECSIITSIHSDPPGAKIFFKKYQDGENNWFFLGETPLDSLRLAKDYYCWKIEKSNYETIQMVTTKNQLTNSTNFKLDKIGSIPVGMVRVNSGKSEMGFLPEFFYDKYEVTNKEFKEFINKGGYRNPDYWKFSFEMDGKILNLDEVISHFVDKTGRHGPATWIAGDYPNGEDDYPVTGISWYEAAAYAAFRKKELPTIYHWSLANGIVYPFPQLPSFLVLPLSNFGQNGIVAVGSYPGISLSGAYDFAGNVREWCFNQSSAGRCIRGGAWSDPPYMAYRITQASPFDRSEQNGFRCVQYLQKESIPEQAFQSYIITREDDDYRRVQPVTNETFWGFKQAFSYDKDPLDSQLEFRDETAENWIKEKISYNAAYPNERIPAYLYLPKNIPPPYQVIIIFPHSGATINNSSINLEDQEGFDFFVKDGRAVLFPVYKGTYERGGSDYWILHGQVSTRKYFDVVTQLVLDFRRSIDYLETRQDIDTAKIAYYSYSWGGELFSIIASVEKRVKLGILNTGGMRGFDAGGKIFPMADPVNYVTRVEIPTLMLNGEYDMIYQFDKVVKPMYDLLGTAVEDKRLITYPTDHFVPRNELIKESLKWLDRYFGPVK